jgi:hypothetical protein
MGELLAIVAVAGLALPVLVVGLSRRRRRCPHAAYQGRAGVVCPSCRRERERVARHLQRVTRSAR